MTFEGEPFAPTWQKTKPADTHRKEFAIACILNSQLAYYDLKARRVPGDPFSLYDLEVRQFDFSTLQYGSLLCRIDLESKPDQFPKHGVPERWVRGVSFTQRKTEKTINYNRDVYLLFDSRLDVYRYPRVIWASYKTIRDFGEPEEFPGRRNKFIVIRTDDYNLLHYSIQDLTKWCKRLRNAELHDP